MVKTASQKFLDLQLRSTVNLERFSEGVRRKVFKILNTAQDDILAELIKQDTRVPMTQWRRARLRNLNKTIDGILDTKYAEIARTTRKEMEQLSLFTAKETVGNLNKAMGAQLANITLTPEYLKSIASNTMIDGQVIGKWWDDQKDDFKKKAARQMADAQQAVQLGMVRGEGINEMVRRIRGTALAPGIMDMSKRNATSLVRTSTMQVANEARMDMYRANEDLINGYEFLATLDKHTTPVCRGYDGKQWKIGKEGNYIAKGHRLPFRQPPLHWRCRSTVVPILKSFSDLIGTGKGVPTKRYTESKISPTQLAKIRKEGEQEYQEALGKIRKSGSALQANLKAGSINVITPLRVLDESKVNAVKNAILRGEKMNPIVVSSSDNILDGYHRLRAYLELYGSNVEIPVVTTSELYYSTLQTTTRILHKYKGEFPPSAFGKIMKSPLSADKIRKLEKLSPIQRAAMTYDEKLLGIGKPVSGNMTYNSWLLTQPEAVQIDVLGPNRFRLWKKHKLSQADMIHQNGRPLSIKELEDKFGEVVKEKS